MRTYQPKSYIGFMRYAKLPVAMNKNFRWSISGLVILILSSLGVNAQNLSGAWKLVNYNGKPFAEECIKIYSDGYFMFAMYSADGAFVKAGGGNYKANGSGIY